MNWKKCLDILLPPFADIKRVKPRDMLYIAQENPPIVTTVALSVQHVLVALTMVIFSIIVGNGIGLKGQQLHNFISMSILIMGVGTTLNSLKTRLSAGHLMVQIPAAITMTVFTSVAVNFGLDAAAGGVLVSGIVIFAFGRFLVPHMQIIFPPEVVGVLLVLLGISLIPAGFNRSTNMGSGAGIQTESVLISAATLFCITGLSVWASDRFRVLAVFIGVCAGLLAAVMLGHFGVEQWNSVSSEPFFALPVDHYLFPTPKFEWAAVLPLVLVGTICAVNKVGAGVVIDKMNDKGWVRPDLPMIARLLNSQGIYNIISGLTGTMITNHSSANIGLVHVTGVTARRVGVGAGLLLMLITFLPRIVTFIVLLPQAVIGAILIYTAAYMIVSGLELIMLRLLNSRRRATTGLSLAVGCALYIVPELTASVPHNLKPILSSGLVVGVLLAIALNLLFRIGVSRKGKLQLDGLNSGSQAILFLEDCGADWGARRDVIVRAGTAVIEALEMLSTARLVTGSVSLEAVFDEHKLILKLIYNGLKLNLPDSQAVDWHTLLEAESSDAALEDAIALLPGMMIRNLADRLESSERNGVAQLLLQFRH